MILVIGATGKNVNLHPMSYLPHAGVGKGATCGRASLGKRGGVADNLERWIGQSTCVPVG